MLMAKSTTNQWYTATQASQKCKQPYFCPTCQQEVFLRQGSQRIAHFVHYRSCPSMFFSEGESPEHLQGKLLLYQWLSQCKGTVSLEPYLSQIQQRPDLLYQTATQQFAIEFQCSAMTTEKLIARTKGYQQAGYQVIWIVGEKHFQNRKTLFLYALPYPCIIHLSVTHLTLCIHWGMCSQEISCQQLFHLPYLAYDHLFCYQTRKHQLSKRFLALAYAERLSIFSFPPQLLCCLASYPGLKSKFSELLVMIYMICQTFQQGSIQLIYTQLDLWITKQFIVFAPMPLVDKKMYLMHLIRICLKQLQVFQFVTLNNCQNYWKFIGR